MKKKVQLSLPVFTLFVLLLAILVNLTAGLLEENRKLREELSKWEALKYHTTPPSKPRFYRAERR